ncbi:MAG TPA: MFS transporter [Acidimicrobiales bacterium]|nr:MFS transporter [Acidimicrobiales bacterium]
MATATPAAAAGEARPGGRLDRGLVAVMAVATGLAVANNYYAQPLLPAIGRSLHLGPGVAGLIVTVAQAGYALGLILLLPLGDLVERRRLVSLLSVATAAALVWLGASPSAASLLPAALVVGAVSVLAQVLVPFAASLASPEERGRVVGMVMSGLLIGVLLARTVAGYLAETGTWRVVYFAAAGAMVVQAVVLYLRLPDYRERTGLSFPRLVGSVVTLLREEPVLRLRSVYGLFSFGTFSVLWTSLAFLLARRYHYSTGVIGLFGLIGAAGALAATLAGRFSDRGWARYSTGAASALLLGSWLLLWLGRSSLPALVLGIVALDVGAQGLHITNQGEIYRLRPEARSRLTAAYMVLYFAGGAAGSVSSATLYADLGWGGVCTAGAAFSAGAFGLWLYRTARRSV